MAFISTSRSHAALHRGGRVSLLDLFSLYRQRRALARLDAHRLNDIGVTRQDADAETQRTFWDVPSHWRS